MCGRYAASRDAVEIAHVFEAEQLPVADPGPKIPNFNVTPTSEVFIVHMDDDVRCVDVARWGLIPSWSKDATRAARMINARSETVADKPAYRSAFRRRRCVVPADGYYEWQVVPGAVKQPYFIHHADGSPLAFAGLYEDWDSPSGRIRSCTILTQQAQGPLAEIHDRMPVLVSSDQLAPWLDSTNDDPQGVLEVLCAEGIPDRPLSAYPVSTRVNKPINNDADLLAPIGPDVAP